MVFKMRKSMDSMDRMWYERGKTKMKNINQKIWMQNKIGYFKNKAIHKITEHTRIKKYMTIKKKRWNW